MTPFIIYGLPRSRTFWLSRFLSYGDWTCGHDEIRHARSLDDVSKWFTQPFVGTVETAAAPFWRLVPEDVRTVVVRRPVDEVVDSLARLGFAAPRAAIQRMDAKLDQIEKRVPGALSVQYADLASEETCARVFEFCLPYKHDHAWWTAMAGLNLQINFPAMLRYYHAYSGQLAKLAKMAEQKTLARMARPVTDTDGLTIQCESFDIFYRDAQKLFANHLVQVGESPDAFREKNIPLMQVLEKIGALQVMTARCNGRMFGYLMTVITPSLESPDIMSALHTTFYASPDFRGLGMKLQRAALKELRRKGVNEVLFRAGTRGSGPKMGALYKRLGAVPVGESYLLELEAA